jgi:protoheme IX farnesyltransferase
MVIGIALIIASGCVFNNYIDRGIDTKMKRTKKRALVAGTVSPAHALTYGSALGIAGSAALLLGTNALTLCVALTGLFFYVVVYGVAKRRTVHGTVIGSISGAIPPVVGYTAAAGQLDGAALLIFLVLVCWQMPHFYAIAMFRKDDYAAARIPVLPVVKGMQVTKYYILAYVVLFIIAVALMTLLGYTGYVYVAIMEAIGVFWLYRGVRGLRVTNDIAWARGMFFVSLIALPALPVALLADKLI